MKRIALAILSLCTLFSASAQEFFDTGEPEEVFELGARLGINTSNSVTKKDFAPVYNHCSWGTGFDAGIVANLNIRNYISVQPGFFFESRSGSYTFIDYEAPLNPGAGQTLQVAAGNYLRYTFTVPIMLSFHFNVANDVRWNVEAGPYFAFNLKTNVSDKNEFKSDAGRDITIKHKAMDFGFKMGTGLTLFDRYEVYAHYMAGCNNAWKKDIMGGRNKAWVFTLGYLFF